MADKKGIQNFQTQLRTWIKDLVEAIRGFFIPKTEMQKKARYRQGMHALAFLASTAAFIFFEDRIMKLITLEATEIQKGRYYGGGPF